MVVMMAVVVVVARKRRDTSKNFCVPLATHEYSRRVAKDLAKGSCKEDMYLEPGYYKLTLTKATGMCPDGTQPMWLSNATMNLQPFKGKERTKKWTALIFLVGVLDRLANRKDEVDIPATKFKHYVRKVHCVDQNFSGGKGEIRLEIQGTTLQPNHKLQAALEEAFRVFTKHAFPNKRHPYTPHLKGILVGVPTHRTSCDVKKRTKLCPHYCGDETKWHGILTNGTCKTEPWHLYLLHFKLTELELTGTVCTTAIPQTPPKTGPLRLRILSWLQTALYQPPAPFIRITCLSEDYKTLYGVLKCPDEACKAAPEAEVRKQLKALEGKSLQLKKKKGELPLVQMIYRTRTELTSDDWLIPYPLQAYHSLDHQDADTVALSDTVVPGTATRLAPVAFIFPFALLLC